MFLHSSVFLYCICCLFTPLYPCFNLMFRYLFFFSSSCNKLIIFVFEAFAYFFKNTTNTLLLPASLTDCTKTVYACSCNFWWTLDVIVFVINKASIIFMRCIEVKHFIKIFLRIAYMHSCSFFSHHLCCRCYFRHEWQDLQLPPDDKFFEKLFTSILFALTVLPRKQLREWRRRNIFSNFVLLFELGF